MRLTLSKHHGMHKLDAVQFNLKLKLYKRDVLRTKYIEEKKTNDENECS